ncbi:MAG: hypothetical protein H6810_03600 [Phycisphaeraceae bacterium]|nr:MAG: hypothetical protein H6810_03600 [Phycisphaeraceae bacterium]
MVMEEVELVRAACCVAGVDGEVTERERAVLQRLAERAGIGAASLKAMMDLAKTDEHFRDDQLEMVHADPAKSFETLYRVARIEREVPREECDLLIRFGHKLGLDLDAMNGVIKRVHGE